MVLIAPLIGAAVFLSGLASALPTSSSNYGSSDSSSSSYGSSDSSSSNYGSSDSSSSNYGSSGSSSSNYGGSSSNYGGSSSNYGGSSSNYGGSSSNYGSSDSGSNYGGSSNNQESSSSMMMTTSTTMGYNNQYTTTSTTSASNSYQTSNYGSGSSYWGGSGYEDCVNQCIAQFGGGSTGGGSYQATATSGTGGAAGTNGVTHTVLVAPTQGVLRMVPFATNASVGDTIEFHWGGNTHTVTKSSALLPCNKSAEAPVFASGTHDKDFVFSEVVNDTNPIYYYCGTPGHCEKGMFGVINPAQAAPGSPSSLGMMMAGMAANDSSMAAYSAYAANVTASNNAANTWGQNFDMSVIPDWAAADFAANVMYNRVLMAKNPEIIQADNSMNLASVATTPLDLPMDLTPALNAAAAPASSGAPAAATPTAAGDAATAAASSPSASTSSTAKNGASSVASSKMLVGAMVVLATIFAL